MLFGLRCCLFSIFEFDIQGIGLFDLRAADYRECFLISEFRNWRSDSSDTAGRHAQSTRSDCNLGRLRNGSFFDACWIYPAAGKPRLAHHFAGRLYGVAVVHSVAGAWTRFFGSEFLSRSMEDCYRRRRTDSPGTGGFHGDRVALSAVDKVRTLLPRYTSTRIVSSSIHYQRASALSHTYGHRDCSASAAD